MNLLNVLGNVMGNDASLDALSEKTGATKEESTSLLTNALPVLLQKLTSNSSSNEGAQSLFNALGAHKEEGAISEQIKNVDEEDGKKIVKHILGEDSDNVIQSLTASTGMSSDKVNQGLSSIAPALMSILSSAVGSGNSSNQGGGIDLGNVLSLFGGNSNSGSGLDFGSLLGGAAQPQQQTQQSSGGGFLSFLGNLFGGKKKEEEPVQTLSQNDNSGTDGTQLLSILTSLLK
jgi:hypothetical protein